MAQLAVWEYEQECRKCPALIPEKFEEELREIIMGTLDGKYAKVALEDGQLVGFLVFFGPWDGFFGNVKGAFSPLGCSAFGGKNREKLASMLFEKVSMEMAEDNVCSYACSRYAHDEEVGKSFVMNGFGIRCSDAILRLKERHIVEELDSQFTYTELSFFQPTWILLNSGLNEMKSECLQLKQEKKS